MEAFRLVMPLPGIVAKVASAPGCVFTLGFFPVGMRFERGGSNLYIDAPDGAQLIIIEYFAHPELPAFYTADGKLVAGADFLMIMNPLMDLSVAGVSAAPDGKYTPIFSDTGHSWDGGLYQLADQRHTDTDYHDIYPGAAHAHDAPAHNAHGTTADNIGDNYHYWTGEDAVRGQALIQDLVGSVTVTLITPPGTTHDAVLKYLTLLGQDASFNDTSESADNIGLFQVGLMGRSSIIRRCARAGDTLTLTVEGYSSFYAYFGDWLIMTFSSMQVQGIEVLFNTPSGQSVVDLEGFFSHAVFFDVPIAWSYDEGNKLTNGLLDAGDENLELFDFLDVLEHEHTVLPSHGDSSPIEEKQLPRMDPLVLVRAETNSPVRLIDEWVAEDLLEHASHSMFTFDEHTLLLHGDEPKTSE